MSQFEQQIIVDFFLIDFYTSTYEHHPVFIIRREVEVHHLRNQLPPRRNFKNDGIEFQSAKFNPTIR
jgi:hypothetical protein